MKPIKRSTKPLTEEEEKRLFLSNEKTESGRFSPMSGLVGVISRQRSFSQEELDERNAARQKDGAILSEGAKTLEEAQAIKALFPETYNDLLKGTSQEILDELKKEEDIEKEIDENIDEQECLKISYYSCFGTSVFVTGFKWYSEDGRIINQKMYDPPQLFREFLSAETAASFVQKENEDNEIELSSFLNVR